MLRFFSSCLLVALPWVAWAQKTDADTTDYLPTGIRIGTDLISLGKSFAGDKFDGWEVNADIDFRRYYLTADYGNWARNVSIENGSYTNNGSYFRIGADVNFLLKDPDRNMFFLGMRYGRASFKEQVVYQVRDTIFGDAGYALENADLRARWAELTLGLRVKIWKHLWMGYTAKMKFFPKVNNQTEITTYDIPGYGLAAKRTYYGFNYQIFWKIPFRKDD